MSLIRSLLRQLARAKRDAALKARRSFKMVISRLREHLARGQFNSGWMIAPSHLCRVPLFFSVCLCLPGISSDSARSNSFYIPGARPCDFSVRSFLFFFLLPLQESVGWLSRLCTINSLLSLFSPLFFVSRSNGTPLFLFPSNYFNGNCFSLVSIRIYNTRNFPNRHYRRRSSVLLNLDT